MSNMMNRMAGVAIGDEMLPMYEAKPYACRSPAEPAVLLLDRATCLIYIYISIYLIILSRQLISSLFLFLFPVVT